MLDQSEISVICQPCTVATICDTQTELQVHLTEIDVTITIKVCRAYSHFRIAEPADTSRWFITCCILNAAGLLVGCQTNMLLPRFQCCSGSLREV